ncbi:MAG TPA: hypothetical protein VGM05_25390 [Planctomycetaceae bacterium]|jgi:hypothetical protein
MTKVIVDPTTGAKLALARDPLELCDDSGHVFGHFIPLPEGNGQSLMEPQVSDEELDRRAREGGGRTLDEILADLGKKA